MPHDNSPFALVVDDDAVILMHACDILEEAGFRPVEAYTAEEAIGLMERHAGEITLLFTDVDLGTGRNGFELVAETTARWPDIAVLVASGDRVPEDGQLPDGAVFIRKPFSAHIVHDRLQELLPDGRKPDPLRRRSDANASD